MVASELLTPLCLRGVVTGVSSENFTFYGVHFTISFGCFGGGSALRDRKVAVFYVHYILKLPLQLQV
jgi:hypothetical protein